MTNSNGIEVLLNVYDLSPNNKLTERFGVGFYHCGVQVGPQEYSFGQGEVTPQTGYDELVEQTGVHRCEPHNAPGAIFKRAISMGYTQLSYSEVDRLVNRMSASYRRADYNLFIKNCNWFCDELCVALTKKNIPSYINRLPNFAGWVAPSYGEDPKIKEKRLAARRPALTVHHTHYPQMNPKIDWERTDVGFTTIKGRPAWGREEFHYSTAYNLAWLGTFSTAVMALIFAAGWMLWAATLATLVGPYAFLLFLFLVVTTCSCTICIVPLLFPCFPCVACIPFAAACCHPAPFMAAFCGAHRFYLGKPRTGLLWAVTGGLFGIGQLLDFFLLEQYVNEANEILNNDPEAGRASAGGNDAQSGTGRGGRRLGGSQVLHIEDIRLQRMHTLQRTSADRQAEFDAERALREEQNKEYERALQHDIERQKMKQEAEKAQSSSKASEKAPEPTPEAAAETKEANDAKVVEERQRLCDVLMATLPAEPAAGNGTTMIKVLLPNGNTATRRFRDDARLGEVVGFANAHAGTSIHDIADYILVSDFPKRAYADESSTLVAAGLAPSALLRLTPRVDVSTEELSAAAAPAGFGYAEPGSSKSHSADAPSSLPKLLTGMETVQTGGASGVPASP